MDEDDDGLFARPSAKAEFKFIDFQIAAIRILGRIGNQRALPALEALVHAPPGPVSFDPDGRKASALQAICALTGTKVVADHIRNIATLDSKLIIEIGRLGGDLTRALLDAVERLVDDGRTLDAKAVWAIGTLGPQAIPTVEKILHTEGAAAKAAAQALSSLLDRDAKSVETRILEQIEGLEGFPVRVKSHDDCGVFGEADIQLDLAPIRQLARQELLRRGREKHGVWSS